MVSKQMEFYKNANELAWKAGSIVGFSSKQLVSVTKCNFKLVKVAPLAIYPVHVHPAKTEVLLILEGTISATINDKKYEGKPSDLFVFPSGTQHGIINTSNSECLIYIASINDI